MLQTGSVDHIAYMCTVSVYTGANWQMMIETRNLRACFSSCDNGQKLNLTFFFTSSVFAHIHPP